MQTTKKVKQHMPPLHAWKPAILTPQLSFEVALAARLCAWTLRCRARGTRLPTVSSPPASANNASSLSPLAATQRRISLAASAHAGGGAWRSARCAPSHRPEPRLRTTTTQKKLSTQIQHNRTCCFPDARPVSFVSAGFAARSRNHPEPLKGCRSIVHGIS